MAVWPGLSGLRIRGERYKICTRGIFRARDEYQYFALLLHAVTACCNCMLRLQKLEVHAAHMHSFRFLDCQKHRSAIIIKTMARAELSNAIRGNGMPCSDFRACRLRFCM